MMPAKTLSVIDTNIVREFGESSHPDLSLDLSKEVAAFSPEHPGHFLKLEKVDKLRSPKLFMDVTEYGEKVKEPSLLHFRGGDSRKPSSAALEPDDSLGSVIDSLGVPAGVDLLVTAIETLPTHPVVLNAVGQVDDWAQETRAGFAGYFESLKSLWNRESGSVEHKLFEAADAYSHRFFNLVHIKESDHPVLAAKMTRIILALVLSLSLVFVIFGLALHLQRTLVAKAHEEAAKQQPTKPEEIFFAMPYPHLRGEGDIVIVNNK